MANAILDQNHNDLSVDEFSNIDSSLVMSFLEDEDDEMVRLMIESLGPELMNQCSSSSETDDSEHRFGEESCCSASPADFEWIDTEMAYSCPGDEVAGYFVGRFMAEFEGLEDYSSRVWYDEMPMEEDDYIGLWQ